jgi:hypothetical protein
MRRPSSPVNTQACPCAAGIPTGPLVPALSLYDQSKNKVWDKFQSLCDRCWHLGLQFLTCRVGQEGLSLSTGETLPMKLPAHMQTPPTYNLYSNLRALPISSASSQAIGTGVRAQAQFSRLERLRDTLLLFGDHSVNVAVRHPALPRATVVDHGSVSPCLFVYTFDMPHAVWRYRRSSLTSVLSIKIYDASQYLHITRTPRRPILDSISVFTTTTTLGAEHRLQTRSEY